jgi:hypothetical protein
LEILDHKVLKVFRVARVFKDQLDQKVTKERLGLKAFRVFKEFRVPRVTRETRDLRVSKEILDHRET